MVGISIVWIQVLGDQSRSNIKNN